MVARVIQIPGKSEFQMHDLFVIPNFPILLENKEKMWWISSYVYLHESKLYGVQ